MRGVWLALAAVAALGTYACGTLLSIDEDPGTVPIREAGASGDSDVDGASDARADCGTCDAGDAGIHDAGCDARTSCSADQCGTASNGCGGTIVCAPCSGNRFCDVEAGACQMCSLYGAGCAPLMGGVSTCPGGATGNRYICDHAPARPECQYCPNTATGQGLFYCCP